MYRIGVRNELSGRRSLIDEWMGSSGRCRTRRKRPSRPQGLATSYQTFVHELLRTMCVATPHYFATKSDEVEDNRNSTKSSSRRKHQIITNQTQWSPHAPRCQLAA
jgi:hypothetical protein